MDSITEIKKILSDQNHLNFEIIPLNTPISFHHYSQWLDKGLHGEMKYMANQSTVREKPDQHFKEMKSIIVIEQSYYPIEDPSSAQLKSLRVAHYARNKDYHLWFREKLNHLIQTLKTHFPEESFQSFTDAVPLLERDYGAQAALGWIGKNTCLIHPKKGSLFFIGEILTSLKATTKPEPLRDFCGSCNACIDECPTSAITSNRVLDANKCISYWNIESKKNPPLEIREKMGDWFFGCDICQTVCPWNIKLHKHQTDFLDSRENVENQEDELRFILTSSNKKLFQTVKDTPLSRAGGRGLKRNALIVIGNMKIKNLEPEVKSLIEHESLGELATWALEKLKNNKIHI